MLEKGRVDVYLDALSDIEQYIEEQMIEMAPYRVETVWTTNAYIAFTQSKTSAQLSEIYDKRIPELFASGELQTIFEQWEVEPPAFKPDDD